MPDDQNEPLTATSIRSTSFRIDTDLFGSRSVVVEHERCEPFCFAVFHPHPLYIGNATTLALAQHVAKALGASDPIPQKMAINMSTPPSADVRDENIALKAKCAELLAQRDEARALATQAAGEIAMYHYAEKNGWTLAEVKEIGRACSFDVGGVGGRWWNGRQSPAFRLTGSVGVMDMADRNARRKGWRECEAAQSMHLPVMDAELSRGF